jgi:putative Ca2+/H+ antiporter (TMEM165/GDT1 family)
MTLVLAFLLIFVCFSFLLLSLIASLPSGDRSQIATIALAAAKNPYGVIVGGLIGHALCTGMAVIGGRMLAAKISEKSVAIVGGILFLFFGITAFIYGPELEGSAAASAASIVSSQSGVLNFQ